MSRPRTPPINTAASVASTTTTVATTGAVSDLKDSFKDHLISSFKKDLKACESFQEKVDFDVEKFIISKYQATFNSQPGSEELNALSKELSKIHVAEIKASLTIQNFVNLYGGKFHNSLDVVNRPFDDLPADQFGEKAKLTDLNDLTVDRDCYLLGSTTTGKLINKFSGILADLKSINWPKEISQSDDNNELNRMKQGYIFSALNKQFFEESKKLLSQGKDVSELQFKYELAKAAAENYDPVKRTIDTNAVKAKLKLKLSRKENVDNKSTSKSVDKLGNPVRGLGKHIFQMQIPSTHSLLDENDFRLLEKNLKGESATLLFQKDPMLLVNSAEQIWNPAYDKFMKATGLDQKDPTNTAIYKEFTSKAGLTIGNFQLPGFAKITGTGRMKEYVSNLQRVSNEPFRNSKNKLVTMARDIKNNYLEQKKKYVQGDSKEDLNAWLKKKGFAVTAEERSKHFMDFVIDKEHHSTAILAVMLNKLGEIGVCDTSDCREVHNFTKDYETLYSALYKNLQALTADSLKQSLSSDIQQIAYPKHTKSASSPPASVTSGGLTATPPTPKRTVSTAASANMTMIASRLNHGDAKKGLTVIAESVAPASSDFKGVKTTATQSATATATAAAEAPLTLDGLKSKLEDIAKDDKNFSSTEPKLKSQCSVLLKSVIANDYSSVDALVDQIVKLRDSVTDSVSSGLSTNNNLAVSLNDILPKAKQDDSIAPPPPSFSH